MERLITKSFKRLMDKGVHRGFITHEELAKSLGKRHFSQKNIEEAFLHIFDNKVCLVEKKSDYNVIKKRDSGASESDSDKNRETDKSDDPIRMYLREMGGVELLSREGEIAIAKRIEAGKDYMITGLFQSPLTGRKVFEWKEKLESGELLIREIIDIDSSYIESESDDQAIDVKKAKSKDEDNKLEKSKKKSNESESEKTQGDEKNNEVLEEDEFNPSLAAMEEEIKPQIISTMNNLCKDYSKLIKSQNDKLNSALKGQSFSRSKEKNYQKIQDGIIKKIKTLQLNSTVLENLLETHYQESKKITSLEGLLLRLVVENKIPRDEFLKHAWEWKEKYGNTILSQLKRLGASCDWSKTAFTMDENYTKAVQEVFVKLYNDNMIYQGERIINWDPIGLTALSDEEVIHKEEVINTVPFKYKIKWKSYFHKILSLFTNSNQFSEKYDINNSAEERLEFYLTRSEEFNERWYNDNIAQYLDFEGV